MYLTGYFQMHRSSVIDSFRRTPEKLAYFYCDRAEETRRDPHSILCTLIQQLVQTDSEEGLLTRVVNIYQDREKRSQRKAWLSLQECQGLLIHIVEMYPQTIICIDAMDEVHSDTRIVLLNCLKDVIETAKTVVKIFVTTRMDMDILIHLRIFPRIDLQPDDNVGDINEFVRTKIKSAVGNGLLLHGDVSDDLQEEICNVLCQRCKGK